MSLPTFIVIGAMKGGTTSLHNYLGKHPDIFMSKQKELNFFNTSLNWAKGIEWYKSNFNTQKEHRGEASPNYSKWSGTAERIYTIIPNVKIMYILRHPVKRFVSHCNHLQRDPNTEVEKLRGGLSSDIFTSGLYYNWLLEYTTYFPKNNILVITSEDLQNHQEETLKKIFQFLGVAVESFPFGSSELNVKQHETVHKKVATEAVSGLNKNTLYRSVKDKLGPLWPMFRPLWKRMMYKDRVIRELSLENKRYLSTLYQENLKQLNAEFGVQYEQY